MSFLSELFPEPENWNLDLFWLWIKKTQNLWLLNSQEYLSLGSSESRKFTFSFRHFQDQVPRIQYCF